MVAVKTKTKTQAKGKPQPAHPLKLDGKSWDRRAVMTHICERLASSSNGIAKILAAGYRGHTLPEYATITAWLLADAEISAMYTRAKEDQADWMADEMLEIADDSVNDTYIDDDGNVRLNQEVVARSKLRLETRKWLAAKLKPRKYGDKVQQEVTGAIQHDVSIKVTFK